MKHSTLMALIFSAGLVAIAMPNAYAGSNSDEASETLSLQNAKVTLEEAAKAATAKFPGTVSSVQVYDDAGKPAFHVEVIGADGHQQDLSVDGTTGEVMKMAANESGDDGDRGHDNGEQGDGDGERAD
jgi:uncharacterized membrane protein YkoI